MPKSQVHIMVEQKHGCPVWTSKDGSITPIKLMEIGHLQNARKVILREINAGTAKPAEGDLQPFYESHDSRWLGVFESELQRRGMIV